jgi:hypothetical protein
MRNHRHREHDNKMPLHVYSLLVVKYLVSTWKLLEPSPRTWKIQRWGTWNPTRALSPPPQRGPHENPVPETRETTVGSMRHHRREHDNKWPGTTNNMPFHVTLPSLLVHESFWNLPNDT